MYNHLNHHLDYYPVNINYVLLQITQIAYS